VKATGVVLPELLQNIISILKATGFWKRDLRMRNNDICSCLELLTFNVTKGKDSKWRE